MAHDYKRIIESLLCMTVANGCTPDEARKARAKAEELSSKYHIPIETPKPKAGVFTGRSPRSTNPFYGFNMGDVQDAIRRAAAEALRRQRQEEDLRRQRERRSFKTVGEACVFYARPGWVNSKTKKPLSNEEIAILVRRHFPDARTTARTVASYKSRAKRDGTL
jgi:hypothetical protein